MPRAETDRLDRETAAMRAIGSLRFVATIAADAGSKSTLCLDSEDAAWFFQLVIARVTRRWTEQMCEMAAHIGPYRTLLVVDALGGQVVDIPKRVELNRLAPVIGQEGAAILSWAYGGDRLRIPVARAALAEARRSGIIAAIRSGRMTIADAVPILGSSRSYISHLVNATNEGKESAPLFALKARRDTRQLDLFRPVAPSPSADG
jgi:hypothetical protein